jgi:hypothetical protein
MVRQSVLNQTSPLTELTASEEAHDVSSLSQMTATIKASQGSEPNYELGMWLCSLSCFFKAQNHPLSENEHAEVLTRDWSAEMRVARLALLRCSQLTLQLMDSIIAGEALLESSEDSNALVYAASGESSGEEYSGEAIRPLDELTELLSSACTLSETTLNAPRVSFETWAGLGKMLTLKLEGLSEAQTRIKAAGHQANSNLQPALLSLTNHGIKPDALAADIRRIFSRLSSLLSYLRFIETILRRDQPLKQTLPLFTLVHEGARSLVEFIETRALRTENLDEAVFDGLDGTNYAISMELRKVFSHELVGLSTLRHAPAIYAKVENAHGLLRDCFQQSTVSLVQLFDPMLDGVHLFNAFQTKLEQSLALRRDLWMLLQMVRRAEKERDQRPIASLLDKLAVFREGSLRYLMYKDWEACERFMEEVGAARGAVELTPVLHRFGTYLETLHGQVNMRAVLADHPFEFPPLEN